MTFKTALFLGLALCSSASYAVEVNFSGQFDGFNTGPFGSGMAFSGSFTLDESVVATGVNNDFFGAVDNFQLTIGSFSFTGENGLVKQFSSSNGSLDFFGLWIGGINGTVSGPSVNGFDFESVRLDWRGANLFGDPTILASNLTQPDFNYTRVVFGFDGSLNSVIDNNVTTINFGPGGNTTTSVPEASALSLFALSLLGLGFGRRILRSL